MADDDDLTPLEELSCCLRRRGVRVTADRWQEDLQKAAPAAGAATRKPRAAFTLPTPDLQGQKGTRLLLEVAPRLDT
jgi:hypothetical protein